MPAAIVLRLGSSSFLDTVLTQDCGAPAYAIDSRGVSTTVSRCTASGTLQPVAAVHWERGVRVQLLGAPCQSLHTFLRASRSPLCPASTRKFRHAGTSYRWRRSAGPSGALECTTREHGQVAVYEPALLTSRPKLRVFEPFAHDVSLVDTLVVSALLMVERPPAVAAAADLHPRRWLSSEPQSPSALPRYSVLADAFSEVPRSPATYHSDVQHRTTLLITRHDTTVARQARSHLTIDTSSPTSPTSTASSYPWSLASSPVSPVTSPVSSSDAWAQRPWAAACSPCRPAWLQSDLDAADARQELDESKLPPPVPIIITTPQDIKELFPLPSVGDEPEPPPPYDQHEWTVLIPADRSAVV